MKDTENQIRLRIRKAFLSLTKEKAIDRIRINELVKVAGCSRRSFYNNYPDIYQLEKEIRMGFYTGLYNVCAASQGEFDKGLTEYLYQNADVMMAFSRPETLREFVSDSTEEYMRIFSQNYSSSFTNINYNQKRVAFIYHFCGFLAVLQAYEGRLDEITFPLPAEPVSLSEPSAQDAVPQKDPVYSAGR